MNGALQRTWAILAVPLISIVMSVIVGSIVIIASAWLVTGELQPGLAVDAFAALVEGSVGDSRVIVSTLYTTMPLLLGGLSVGLAFKGGLFNIGAQGQFWMGVLGSVIVGVQLREAPAVIAVPAALAGGMLFGLVWGFIPGFLKATSGAHEVVTTIMLNFVAFYVLAAAVNGPLNAGGTSPITADTGNAALPVIVGENGHIGLIYAPLMVVLYGFLLFRTTRGFEIRVVGVSPEAARYAGMSPRRLIIWTMSAAGLLAGLAGATDLLGSPSHQTASNYATTVGFDAIAIALLGRTSPIGILLSALLFGALRTGSQQMQISPGVPAEIVGVLQATILFFLVVSPVIVRRFGIRGAKSGLEESATISGTYGSEAVR
jgi:general nucleoside transport system permease protein